MYNPGQRKSQQLQLILKRFPVHHQNKTFQTYNLYYQTQQSGVQKSIPLKYPCIRQGCLTSCYFEAKSLKTNANKPCDNCKKQHWQKVYLDIGLKQFIDRQRHYILANAPINVLINPWTNQYFFKTKSLKNNLQGALSCFIASQLVKQMNLDQIPMLHQNSLDFYKIYNNLKPIFKPPQRESPYYIYSFCKYYPKTQQQTCHIFILLFIKGIEQPIKARILKQNRKEICKTQTYLKYVKIVCLAKSNTLIFSVPNKRKTQYFISNVSFHLNLQEKKLFLWHQKEWSDQLPRINGSLIANQENNSVFAIGGYDYTKNDSLDYISCFLDCKWMKTNDKLYFTAKVQKDNHLFRLQNSINQNLFASYLKSEENMSKFAIISSAFLVISSLYSSKTQTKSSQQMKYKLFSLGGRTKDSIFFKSNKFSYQPPGIRTILYDKTLHTNPIIHERISYQINFDRNNYILVELPHLKTLGKGYKDLVLAFGGQQNQQQNHKQSNQQVYIFNINKIDQAKIIQPKLIFGQFLAENIDQSSSLLYDDQTKQYYVRLTIPFKRPIELAKSQHIHYLVVQFNLITGCLMFKPGIVQSK